MFHQTGGWQGRHILWASLLHKEDLKPDEAHPEPWKLAKWFSPQLLSFTSTWHQNVVRKMEERGGERACCANCFELLKERWDVSSTNKPIDAAKISISFLSQDFIYFPLLGLGFTNEPWNNPDKDSLEPFKGRKWLPRSTLFPSGEEAIFLTLQGEIKHVLRDSQVTCSFGMQSKVLLSISGGAPSLYAIVLVEVPMTRSSKLSPNMAGVGNSFSRSRKSLWPELRPPLRIPLPASQSWVLGARRERREAKQTRSSPSLPHSRQQPHNPDSWRGGFAASSCSKQPLRCCQCLGELKQRFPLGRVFVLEQEERAGVVKKKRGGSNPNSYFIPALPPPPLFFWQPRGPDGFLMLPSSGQK